MPIRARGSENNQDTGLLALGQRQFRSADLADHIIALTRNQQAVNDERKYRQDLAEEKRFLEASTSTTAVWPRKPTRKTAA